MRLLILGVKEYPFYGFAKDVGGIDVFTSELSRRLLQRGIHLVVITRSSPKLKNKEQIENLKIIRVPYFPSRLLKAVSYNFRAFLKAIRLIKNKEIDLIYTGETIAGFFVSILKRLFQIPFVAKIGTFGSKQPEWPFYARFFLKIFEKRTLCNANAVILTNKEGMTYAAKLAKNKIRKNSYIIPNAVDFEKFRNGHGANIRNEFNISEKCFVILFVGRFTESKGLPYLIKAFKLLISKKEFNKQKMKLFLVGDGILYPKIKALIEQLNLSDSIILPGHRSDISDIMNAANVFCLPSLYEAFPLVILEAMAAGLPTIASNIGAIPEVITDKVNGILIPPKNPNALADAIYSLYNNQVLYKGIKKNVLTTAQSYSWETLVSRYLEIFNNVLSFS